MKYLRIYINFIDSWNLKFGALVSWLTTFLVLLVCYDVFTRYFLKESSVAIQELEWHIFAVLFLMSAGYTLQQDKHVRVDLLYSRFSPKKQAWINLIGCFLFLIPFCVLIIFTSKNFVLNSFSVKEISPDPGGLPARYGLKAIIPLSFLVLLFQGISLLFKSLLTILSTEEIDN